tara:strand:+ start:2496 stop:3920 length:1425 start_codon:yes stop_codon:yes gene_type:complete
MNSTVRVPASIRWVIIAALLLIILQSTQEMLVFHLDEMKLVLTSDYVWNISVNNGVLPISLRNHILFYSRWLPLVILAAMPLSLAIQKRGMPRAIERADAYIVVFTLFAFISCLYSINPRLSFLRAGSVLLMYGAVFWGVWLYADDFGGEAVANTIVIVIAIVFGLHILNAVTDPAGSFPYLGRFQGWTINPGIAAGHASVLLPFALWIASQRSRWQYWVLVGAILFVLIMSQTRTEIVAAAIGSTYFLVRTYPKRIYVVLSGTLSVLIMSYMWIEVGPRIFPQGTEFSLDHIANTLLDNNLDSGEEYNELEMPEVWYDRFNPRTSDAKTLAHRTDKWRLGLKYFMERPLQGFGFGTEDRLFAYHDVNPQDYQLSGASMHNSYLGLVLQVGIVGAALFYVPLASLLFYELLTARETHRKPLLSALLSVVITCMVAGMFSSDLYSMGNAKSFVFWISVMLLVRSTVKSKDMSISI